MRNLKIGMKLFILVAFLVVSIITVGVFAMIYMGEINNISTIISTNSIPSVIIVEELNTLTSDFHVRQYRHILADDKARIDAAEKEMETIKAQIQKFFENYIPLITNDKDKALIEETMKLWGEFLKKQEGVINLSRDKKTDEALAILRDELIPLFDEVSENFLELVEFNKDVATQMSRYGDELYASGAFYTTITIVAVTLLSLVLAIYIVKMITKPLRRLELIAGRAENGDLTIKYSDFQYDSKDELGMVVKAMSAMVSNQAEVTSKTIAVAKRVSDESESIAALSEQTSASVQEIVAAVSEVNNLSENNSGALQESNAGIEEMAAGASTVAQSASNGAEGVAETGRMSEKAVEMVKHVIDEMQNVGDRSRENETEIRKLAESVEHISGFVNVITSIADQTNLLALNAAIEAARAGEAGRGFAVVADEVRKLAEESGSAAKSISELISGLQENAKGAIEGTVESAKIIGVTLSSSADAQKALLEANSKLQVVNEGIQNIAAVAEEQAASSKEMASSLDVVTKGTVEVVTRLQSVKNSTDDAGKASENLANSAQNLELLSNGLVEILSHFKVEEKALAELKQTQGRS